MRVYLPSTLQALAAAAAAGEVGPAPLAGCAVTPALREWYAEGDQEELEYAALTAAAGLSLRLLAVDPTAPRRRVVLAADVPDRAAEPGPESRAAVRLTVAVPLSQVAAIHVDDPAVIEAVGVAVVALPAADGGDPDAEFLLDEAESHELQWFTPAEIRELTEGGPSGPALGR